MKITTRDLREWTANNTTIRYHNQLYRLSHNGRKWMLYPFPLDQKREPIALYHKARGVYGLDTNKI